MTRKARILIASAVSSLLVLMGLIAFNQPASAFISSNGQTRTITGCNTSRGTDALILYTRANGRTSTRTNSAGVEAAFLNGRITSLRNGVGNMTIPVGGAVISAHGTARTWVLNNVRVGSTVELRPRCVAAPPQPAPNYTITTMTTTRVATGCDIYRRTDSLVIYSRLYGQTVSPANSAGYEVAVQNGRVVETRNGQVGMPIPTGGAVLSAHGTSRLWLQANLPLGAWVSLPNCSGVVNTPRPTTTTPPPTNSTQLLPDLRVRTLTQDSIFIDTSTRPGQKQLRFRAVTANIGAGPLEVNGARSSTATGHVITQRIYRQDGTWNDVPARTGTRHAEFYFAGDGHNHWHIRDFDEFVLTETGGLVIRNQEKHGFCFEDNTEYRNWPSEGVNGTSPNPHYLPGQVCGANQPNALNVQEGISKGWSDTYSTSLPDQFIDITNVPDGTYRLRQTADWDNWFQESDESNNTVTTTIVISGNTVTVTGTSGGA